jgi:hypothetical protein
MTDDLREAAMETTQRERMATRFANRGKSAPSADFDLPAASDELSTPEPSQKLYLRGHNDDGTEWFGTAAELIEDLLTAAETEARLADQIATERDALLEALSALLLDVESRPRHGAESDAVKRARELTRERT